MEKGPSELEYDRRLGAILRDARLSLGLSQQQVADRVGCTFQQVAKYERAENRIAASRLITVCKAMKISPTELIGKLDEDRDTEPLALVPNTHEFVGKLARLETHQRRTIMDWLDQMIRSKAA